MTDESNSSTTDDLWENKELLVDAREEAQAIVEREVNWLRESEKDFMRIFRFNILVIGLVISGISLGVSNIEVVTVADFENKFIYCSLFFWTMSTILSVVTYGGLRAQLGSERLFRIQSTPFSDIRSLRTPEDVKSLENHFQNTPLSEVKSTKDYHQTILDSYVRAINANEHEAALRYGLYNVVLLLLVSSVVLFTLSIFISITGSSSLIGLFGLAYIVTIIGFILTVIAMVGLYNLFEKYTDKIRGMRNN